MLSLSFSLAMPDPASRRHEAHQGRGIELAFASRLHELSLSGVVESDKALEVSPRSHGGICHRAKSQSSLESSVHRVGVSPAAVMPLVSFRAMAHQC